MLDLVGKDTEISLDIKRTMGAGDSVSSVLSMAHLWDMEELMGQMRESGHPIDTKYMEIAGTLFTSLLSRVAGEILYHSNRCDWMSVPPEKFREIIAVTAKKSLDLAADLWNQVDQKPTIAKEQEWDIDLAMWQL